MNSSIPSYHKPTHADSSHVRIQLVAYACGRNGHDLDLVFEDII